MNKKVCSACGETKAISQFHRRGKGHDCMCVECRQKTIHSPRPKKQLLWHDERRKDEEVRLTDEQIEALSVLVEMEIDNIVMYANSYVNSNVRKLCGANHE